jgi:hypothetical protein
VLEFIEHYGLKMLGAVAALCVVGLAIYFIKNRLSGRKEPETGTGETSDLTGEARVKTDAPSSTTLS